MSIKPRLGVFDLTMIVVSLVIGMGIFRTPVEVAQKAQMPVIFFTAWILGGVVSFCGALTFAEIGSRYPVAGGFYKIFSHCYHPAFAFMVNWMVVISNAASTASVAIIGAEYINPILMPDVAHGLAIKITTITIMVVLFGINLAGIKMSARVLNVLMIVKILMIILLILAVFGSSGPVHAAAQPGPLQGMDWIKAFFLCFVPVFFTYGGYQQTINFGSDIQNASRNIPRSIFFGIAIILSLYLLVNFSYFRVMGFEGLKNSPALAADMAGVVFGDYAYKAVALVMFVSVLAYVNASVMSNPRIYYAMAEDMVLPPIFKRVNQKTQVQEFALTLFVAFIVLTLFIFTSFRKVLDYVMFFDSIALATAAASIFILRHRAKREGEKEGIYKMKLYPLLPVIFILVYTLVNVSVLWSNREAAGIGFILFVSGLPLYYGLRRLVAPGA
jgi:APA family basic amino acid/polyamine antiporter